MLRIALYDNHFTFSLEGVRSCHADENFQNSLCDMKRIVDAVLYVKNPLLCDAERMAKVKDWAIPRYIPRLLLMATPPDSGAVDAALSDHKYDAPHIIKYSHIPLGLLAAVKDFCAGPHDSGPIKIAFTDYSKNRQVSNNKALQRRLFQDSKLRPYQQQAIQKAVCYKRAQIMSMTGSGKTIIMSGIIRHFDMPTIVLCHRRLLINQWVKAVKHILGKTPHTLVEGRIKKGDCDILIASMQSIGGYSTKSEKAILGKKIYDPLMCRYVATMPAAMPSVLKPKVLDGLRAIGLDLDNLKDLLVIVDEAHVAPAFGFYNIISSLSPTLIYGCTATPDRPDGRAIMSQAIFTHRLIITDTQQVKKHLSPLQYITVEISTLMDNNNNILSSESAVIDAEFVKILLSDMRRYAIVVNAIRQLVLHGYTGVVICGNNIWLVEAMASSLEHAGIKYGIITGETKAKDRDEIIKAIEDRDIKVLLATTTIDVGVDITSLDAAIFPVPFSGETAAIQRAGRIMRQAPGKLKGIIIDFLDLTILRCVYSYYRRRRHILTTFGAQSVDSISDTFPDGNTRDANWTKILQIKG